METLQRDPIQEHIDILKAALSRYVPDMKDGFIIHTKRGIIEIKPEFAEPFRKLAADLLQAQLNKLRTY